MEEQTESKLTISANDLPSLLVVINQYSATIDQANGEVLKHLRHIFLGLTSHNINKRKGYSIILTYLLTKYSDQIKEEEAIPFVELLKYGKDKQKTAIRTGLIAKVLSLAALIHAKIIRTDDYFIQIINDIHSISVSRPLMAPFIHTVLAEIQKETDFKYLQNTMELMKPNLDSFIFLFKVANSCPAEVRQHLPPSFHPSIYNENTAKNLSGSAQATKQPWNSLVWKMIANETPKDELFTFWPQLFGKQIRSTDPTGKVNVTVIHIIRSILPILKPDVYDIIISATFIRMINSLLIKPVLQPQISDFLNFVADMSNDKDTLALIIEYFAHIDYRQPGGFEFHLKLFNKCDEEKLHSIFEHIKNFNENDIMNLKQRISSQKFNDTSLSKFKLDTLRAVFIVSGKFPSPEFTLSLFDYISEVWKENLSILVADIIQYDQRRVEGAATLSQLAKEPNISSFEACYRLYSLCTGVSSSPSLNTLIAPEINNAPPSTDLILMAIQRVGDSVLISHAFRTYLKGIIPQIPTNQIEQFFNDFVPLAESFSQATVDILEVVLKNSEINYNIAAPLFSLFCKTITNVGGPVAQSVGKLLKDVLVANKNAVFAFPTVIQSIFSSMAGLSQKILSQNQKVINKTFNRAMISVIKAAMPLSTSWHKALVKQLDIALLDFAFKSNQHFDEEIFNAFLQLPDDLPHALFPILMKQLSNVKRIHRRVLLLNMVTTIFSTPKGPEVLLKYEKEFNACVMALLGETFQSKEDEKKFTKTIVSLSKWFQFMEKKRNCSTHVNAGDIKRKLSSIQNMVHDPLQTTVKQCLQALQKIEGQVHPKQRMFA